MGNRKLPDLAIFGPGPLPALTPENHPSLPLETISVSATGNPIGMIAVATFMHTPPRPATAWTKGPSTLPSGYGTKGPSMLPSGYEVAISVVHDPQKCEVAIHVVRDLLDKRYRIPYVDPQESALVVV